jgi:hypothetical protein
MRPVSLLDLYVKMCAVFRAIDVVLLFGLRTRCCAVAVGKVLPGLERYFSCLVKCESVSHMYTQFKILHSLLENILAKY